MLRQFSFEGILRVSSTYVWAAFKSHFIPIAVAVAFLHWIISLLFQVIMRAKCVSIILELNCCLRFEETKKLLSSAQRISSLGWTRTAAIWIENENHTCKVCKAILLFIARFIVQICDVLVTVFIVVVYAHIIFLFKTTLCSLFTFCCSLTTHKPVLL